jgi:beta-lactamase class D
MPYQSMLSSLASYLEREEAMRVFFILLAFLGFSYQQLRGEENFILIDGSTSEIIREFGPGIEERVTPASSFKIALSLIGYDAGVLQNEQTPTWDFQEGYDDFSESWKASQTPQTWMTRSCIWFSKIIALQLGIETIERYLSSFEYGNKDLSTGMVPPGPINPLWVSSSLKISPKEQVNFVQKMIQERLSISSKAFQMTKRLLFNEEMAQGWKLFGKTGLVHCKY